MPVLIVSLRYVVAAQPSRTMHDGILRWFIILALLHLLRAKRAAIYSVRIRPSNIMYHTSDYRYHSGR